MKVLLHEEKTFTATVGQRTLHGLLLEQWNGLDRVIDANGRDLILNAGTVVKGHPDLLRDLGLLPVRSGFIRIPARALPNGILVPEFYVSERKASKGDDGKIIIDAARKPWVNINYNDACKACEASGAKLLTGLQAMSIALDICEQDINWTGGKVGEGKVYQGLHRGTVSSAQDGNYESSRDDERRWHRLSTGERIYDFAGNAWEWLFAELHANTDGVINTPFGNDSPYLSAPYPSEEKGMGYRPNGTVNWSGVALLRGGFWGSDDSAGVFALDYGDPRCADDYVGFRCTN